MLSQVKWRKKHLITGAKAKKVATHTKQNAVLVIFLWSLTNNNKQKQHRAECSDIFAPKKSAR